MGGLGSSRVEPSACRAWLVRAGLTKARDAEVPWLVSELDRAEVDRPVRRRWVLAPRAVASLLIGSLPFFTRGGFSVGYAVGFVGVSLAAAWWAPPSIFRYQRRSMLRLHGRNELGGPADRPTRWSRLDPSSYSILQAALGVALVGVLSLGVKTLSRAGTIEVTSCFTSGGYATASIEIDGRGPLARRPRLEWTDPATGRSIASTTLHETSWQTVHHLIDPDAAAAAPTMAVVCEIHD